MNSLLKILINLFLTIFIEIIVLLLFKERRLKVLFGSICINVVTNLSLNLILLALRNTNIIWYIVCLIVGEVLVLFLEWLYYYLLIKDKKRSFFYSFYCNSISFILGLVAYYFILGGLIL